MKRTNRITAFLLALAMLLSGCCTIAGAEESQSQSLMSAIATIFSAQEEASEWVIFDLAKYASINETLPLPEEKKSAYISAAATSVANSENSITEYVKAEIILTALGCDTSAILSESGEMISNSPNFEAITDFPTYSDAIWALIADSLDSVSLTDAQIRAAIAKISESTSESGLLFGTYGDYTYDDPDSTGAAIGALSRYLDEGDTYAISALYNKMLGGLSAAQAESGSLGSACTDAFVIIGLCAAGINPETDARFIKGETNLVDGLMSYAIEGGFAGYDGSLDLAWSTEQGFRALMALQGLAQNPEGYNLYYTAPPQDNEGSEDPNTPVEGENTNPSTGNTTGGLLAGNEKPDTPSDDTEAQEPEEKTITVSFEMKTHKKTWIGSRNINIAESSTVKELISLVFDKYGVESKGLNMGYLRSVTYKGETWGEFDAGPGSGWQYRVNGELPRVGISSYKLYNGDVVSLVYTADYTEDIEKEPEEPLPEEKEETVGIPEPEDAKEPFGDVSESDWFASAVQFVYEKGLMNGTSESAFSPEGTLTRAMFVTVLYRMEGSPEVGEESFEDVASDSWYCAATSWASANGIINGTSEKTFSPDLPITREQMAALAYRYAKHKNIYLSEGNAAFSDAGEISEYAWQAAGWANKTGIMTGFDGRFNPSASSKRCEAAAVFMRLCNAVLK